MKNLSLIFLVLVAVSGLSAAPKHVLAPGDAGALVNGQKTRQFVYLKAEGGLAVPFVVLSPPATSGPTGVVIYLHQGDSDYSIWVDRAIEATKAGLLAVMVEVGVAVEDNRTMNWPQMQYGLETLVNYLQASPQIRKDRMGLAGSSMGANNALVFFGSHPQLRSVLALSPGTNYDNVRPTSSLKQLAGRTAVIASSEDDPVSYAGFAIWQKSIAGPDYVSFKAGGHGLALFHQDNGLLDRYAKWLKTLQ